MGALDGDGVQSENLLGIIVDPHTADNNGPSFGFGIFCRLAEILGNVGLPGEAASLIFVTTVQLLIAYSHPDVLGVQRSIIAVDAARVDLAVDLAINRALVYAERHLGVVHIVAATVDVRAAIKSVCLPANMGAPVKRDAVKESMTGHRVYSSELCCRSGFALRR